MEALNKFLASISDKSLCGWFFFMYILAVVSASFQALYIMFLYVPILMKKGSGAKLSALLAMVMALVVLSIAVFNSLFLYSLCDRSLVKNKA
jgi:hypothetical protein